MRKNRIRGLVPFLSLAAVSLGLASFSAQQEKLLYIKARKIYTCEEKTPVLFNAGILIRGDKILRVDKKAKPPRDAELLDLKDRVIIPGLIDSHTYAGFHQEDFSVQTEPRHPNPFSPAFAPPVADRQPIAEAHYSASQAVFFRDRHFPILLSAGLTTAKIAIPFDGIVGGTSACIKLFAQSPAEFLLQDPAGAEFSLVDENVMQRFGDLKKTFLDALDYRKGFEKYQKDLKTFQAKKATPSDEQPQEPAEPKKNENHEAILMVLDRRVPAMIHASRVNEVEAALQLAQEFNLRLVLVGGQEAYIVAANLNARNIPVIAGPGTTVMKKGLPVSYLMELLKKNIKVAYSSRSSQAAVFLPFQMSYAVQQGLTPAEALKVLTANAAEILGIADRVGSLRPGKDADFVVLSGEPFDLSTKVIQVYVNGNPAFSRDHTEEALR